MKPGELNVYLWRDGFHLFFPMRGRDRWRVIGILPERFRDRDDVKFESLAPSIRQEAGAALDFKSCSWFSTYRIHHRAAERFRDRRCFLLGDAAHVHSPHGRAGHEHGPAGCLQSCMEAGACSPGPRRFSTARHL